jgi:ribonuclease HI
VTEDGHRGTGGEPETTNQRMELTAVAKAIEALPGSLEVYSDSTYVVNCFNDRWYEGWISRGWKNSQKKPVANRDLWEPLIAAYLARRDELTFTWVKGHSGDELNELADQLAVAEVVKLKELANASADASDDPGPIPPWPIERAVVVSGLRELDGDQLEELTSAVTELDPANDLLISGLRLGAELHGAETAIRASVPVGVVLPYADPVQTWSTADRARFDAAVEAAAWVVTLDGDPAKPRTSIERRNAWLWSAAVGAIVVGDEALVEDAELAGLGVIAL